MLLIGMSTNNWKQACYPRYGVLRLFYGIFQWFEGGRGSPKGTLAVSLGPN